MRTKIYPANTIRVPSNPILESKIDDDKDVAINHPVVITAAHGIADNEALLTGGRWNLDYPGDISP